MGVYMISRLMSIQSQDIEIPVFLGYRHVQVLAVDTTWNTASGNWYNSWYTLSMFESTDCTGPDLCVGKPVAASTAGASNPAANAVDGSDTTYWATLGSANQSWFVIDLGAQYCIRSLRFKPRSLPYHPKSIVLKYSNSVIPYPAPSVITGDRLYTTNVPGQLQVFHNLRVPEI
jgi:hypothetical protein